MALLKSIRTVYRHTKTLLEVCNHVVFPVFGKIGNINLTRTLAASNDVPSNISSEVNKKLMFFFDDEKNWGQNEVKVGRSWKKDELRIKSNVDLHKLWYVLLKEKNMLLTMEHESKEEMRLFPNPERIDKVNESMSNVEEVVRERNKAFYMLETGEDGERPGRLVVNRFGLRRFYKMKEHEIPLRKNLKYWRKLAVGFDENPSATRFVKLYREKLFLNKKKQRTRNFNHVQHLFKRFPNMDVEALREQYPDVDIEKAREGRRARGNHEFNS